MGTTLDAARAGAPVSARRRANYARQYWPFIVPAGAVVVAVILFPWVFTLFMSVNDFHVGGARSFTGLANYARMLSDDRFQWSILRTLYFTSLSVLLPVVFGVAAAVCFHRQFPGRGLARTIFIMPMMATPVAIALVWTMMFHPQLGVLNYLLTSVGLPPSSWVYDPDTVIPTLVMVETWQWTPLVMLIVLGGLASLPNDPYEAAVLDGANIWQVFWHVTLPLVWPFIIVAAVIRGIDALKAFDTIFVISNGGPGTASETLNILLYLQAFSFYDIGYASAIVVVFFVLILLVTLLMLHFRQRSQLA
ncbi:MAG TPA: sugar ABC transporter permease [Acetobacteraceae bacterium]|jgi:multiple sugar transport system permease protein|nr:sugar ABC transporter permease [Acetobacteraceae bacterium]